MPSADNRAGEPSWAESVRSADALAGGSSASELHVLYLLGPSSPAQWLTRALLEAEPHNVQVTETPSLVLGLERLREASFDVVLLDQDASPRRPDELLDGIRCSAHLHQAMLVLAEREDRGQAASFLAAGASGYLSLGLTTPQELVWQMHLAAERGRLRAENEQLRAWQRRHEEQEQAEILSLLKEQVSVMGVSARLRGSVAGTESDPQVASLTQDWQELLQAYVVMGRGQMGREVRQFAQRLHAAKVPMAELLCRFAQALQAQVQSRGPRSARHIYDRGNLLLLDLLLQWSDRLPGNERS